MKYGFYAINWETDNVFTGSTNDIDYAREELAEECCAILDWWINGEYIAE